MIELYGPKSSTTKYNTCCVIGLALMKRTISPTVGVVAPLNPYKILPSELRWSSRTFICWKVQQISRAAKINKDYVHIKIVNTQSKYKRIIMRSAIPSRVYRRKGYEAVNRLNCYAALWGTDGVYPNSN